jgi:hypothetical protein
MGGDVRRAPAEPVIVGRDAERGLLSGFLDSGAQAVAAVLTGPAGIGKTALWEWAVEQASGLGRYGAVFGDTYIKIGGLTYVTAAQGKQIVEQLHSKL